MRGRGGLVGRTRPGRLGCGLDTYCGGSGIGVVFGRCFARCVGARDSCLERIELPRATLVTPNVPEIAALLEEAEAGDEAEWIRQGRALLRFGSGAVLVKGGHGEGSEAVDLLISAQGDGCQEEQVERIISRRCEGLQPGNWVCVGLGDCGGIGVGVSRSWMLVRRAKSYVLEMLTHAS